MNPFVVVFEPVKSIRAVHNLLDVGRSWHLDTWPEFHRNPFLASRLIKSPEKPECKVLESRNLAVRIHR